MWMSHSDFSTAEVDEVMLDKTFDANMRLFNLLPTVTSVVSTQVF